MKRDSAITHCFHLPGIIHHAGLVAGLLVSMKKRKYCCINPQYSYVLHSSQYFLFFLCNFVLFLLIRADEQEKLGANSTIIQTGQNVTRELNTDFYLGVYGGNLKRHI